MLNALCKRLCPAKLGAVRGRKSKEEEGRGRKSVFSSEPLCGLAEARERKAGNAGEARHRNEGNNNQKAPFHNILLLTFNMLTKSSEQIPNNISLPCNNNENTNLKTLMKICSGRN